MLNTMRLTLLFFIFALTARIIFSEPLYDKKIDDFNYKFTINFTGDWESKDMKETKDKDGISYSLERKDKKMTALVLAFKLSSVKNLDDFIYNMEKDIALNIPQKSGDYSEKDHGNYDEKSGTYKDDKFHEVIYYFRTKMPDAPNNYVYMIRFITESSNFNNDAESQIKAIAESFKSTIE